MPRIYSHSKVASSILLEVLAFTCLWPLLIIQRPKNDAVRNILLIEPFQMGDVLSLTPLISPLLKKFPGGKVFVFSKPGSGQVLQSDPRISQVFMADIPWADHGAKSLSWRRTWSVIRTVWALRGQRLDVGIDTRGDIRSQILLVLAGCRIRVGYTNYLNSNIDQLGLLLNKREKRGSCVHRFEWNVQLLKQLEIPVHELLPIQFPSFFPDTSPHSPNPAYLVLHIGGGWLYRRWSQEKWSELVNELVRLTDYELMVIGGAGERELVTDIQIRVTSNQRVRFCVTSLQELVQLIRSCDLFVGLDSGPMNLATCLNKKVVALFGPGEFNMWRPLTEGSRVVRRVERFPCSPCLQIMCLYPHHNCMAEIQVEDVMNAIVQTLGSPGNRPDKTKYLSP